MVYLIRYVRKGYFKKYCSTQLEIVKIEIENPFYYISISIYILKQTLSVRHA